MYAKVFQYKFPSITEAKVAASFCSDNLGKQITKFNFQSLNIMIGKEGDLSIFIKFNTIDKLKKFENESNQFIEDLKKTFVFKENQYAGVFVYNYESEATSAQIKINNWRIIICRLDCRLKFELFKLTNLK